jgi:hypothetical protein
MIWIVNNDQSCESKEFAKGSRELVKVVVTKNDESKNNGLTTSEIQVYILEKLWRIKKAF